MARVLEREAAKRDLIGHFVYLAENATPEVARRFKEAARKTFRKLAETPGIGTPGKVRHGRYADVRLWRVAGFERYLIAYRPLKDGVLIERVVHAAQDYRRVLKLAPLKAQRRCRDDQGERSAPEVDEERGIPESL